MPMLLRIPLGTTIFCTKFRRIADLSCLAGLRLKILLETYNTSHAAIVNPDNTSGGNCKYFTDNLV